MRSEIVVERHFHFHCSCGAITVAGERTVTCTGCGKTLGVRRVRKHRQSGDTVRYYGRSLNNRTLKVRRIEKRRHHPNTTSPARSVWSRLSLWVKIALNKLPLRLEAQGAPREIRDEPHANRDAEFEHQSSEQQFRFLCSCGATIVASEKTVTCARCSKAFGIWQVGTHGWNVAPRLESTRLEAQGVHTRLALGSHVKVGPRKRDGSPHPHAGKTGTVTRFLDYSVAMVHLAGCGKTRVEPENSLVSTVRTDKKKACAEKTSNSWTCSATSAPSSEFRRTILCVRCGP
jgi:hypothetical protein